MFHQATHYGDLILKLVIKIKNMETKEIYQKAKYLAVKLLPAWENDLKCISIEENGDIIVNFENYHHGDTDYESETFTMEDLLADSEVTIAKFKAKYEEAKIARKKAEETAKVKEAKDKEEREKATLRKLQEKYGNIL